MWSKALRKSVNGSGWANNFKQFFQKSKTMKLEKGTEIEVYNVIMKPGFQGKNSGFLNVTNRNHRREIGVSELPGAWIVTAQACALDGTICDRCRRIYNFGLRGAVAQCECKGCEVE